MDITNILARIEYLTDALSVLEGQDNDPNNEIEDKCMDLFTNLVAIKKSMDALRTVFGEMKEQHKIAMEKIIELEKLQKHISYIQNNLPKDINSTRFECNKTFSSIIHDTTISQNTVSPIPTSWSHLHSPCVNENGKSKEGTNLSKDSKKNKVYPCITYISPAEFNTVPKYMKGRLNIAVLNRLVDSFNSALKKKYESVRQPKRTVKPKDIEYYNEWKREENTEPKGTSFITGKDLTNFGDMKMDKNALNMITILRHLKRIRETRPVNGSLHYVLL